MLFYYLSEALKYLSRSKLSSLLSILTVAIGVLFATFTIVILMLSSKLEERFKSKIEMNVFLADTLNAAQNNQIKSRIVSFNRVAEVNFESKTDALRKLKNETGEDFSNLLTFNPLPNSFRVSFKRDIEEKELTQFENQIRSINGVTDVVINRDLVFSIFQFIESLKNIIYIASFLLIVISIYLVYSNTKLTLISLSDQIMTMKLVGAKLSAIRLPLIFNGGIKGFIGGILASGIVYVIIITLKKFYIEFQFDTIAYFYNFIPLILGTALGILGSAIMTRSITLKIDSGKNQ